MDKTVDITIHVPLRYAHQALDKIEAVLESVGAKMAQDRPAQNRGSDPTTRQQAEAAKEGGANQVQGVVTEVNPEYKSGKTGKGRAWVLGLVKVEVEGWEWPVKATTFDQDLREKLGHIHVGDPVVVEFESGEKGKKLLDIRLDDKPAF